MAPFIHPPFRSNAYQCQRHQSCAHCGCLSSLALCLPPASLSHVLICPGSQDSLREGLRGQECSETPQHHFPKQPTSARRVTVPDSDPRALETCSPPSLPMLLPCRVVCPERRAFAGPLGLWGWDSLPAPPCPSPTAQSKAHPD